MSQSSWPVRTASLGKHFADDCRRRPHFATWMFDMDSYCTVHSIYIGHILLNMDN